MNQWNVRPLPEKDGEPLALLLSDRKIVDGEFRGGFWRVNGLIVDDARVWGWLPRSEYREDSGK